MKITDIKTFNVFAYRTNFVFVKLETDEGISGIGEGTLEYKENALLGAIEDIKRVLIGQDPREVERISHELYRDSYWRVGPVLQSAVSAVNMAMWDIKAKAAGVPVYEMLGGKLTKRGVIASCIIMFIMVLLSYQIDTAIALYSLDDYKELGFFGCFRLLNYAMFNGGIDWGSYLPDLILLYAFTALGAVPTVSNTLKKHESIGKVYRMGSYAVQSEENINI